jgi:hypothetical protein
MREKTGEFTALGRKVPGPVTKGKAPHIMVFRARS